MDQAEVDPVVRLAEAVKDAARDAPRFERAVLAAANPAAIVGDDVQSVTLPVLYPALSFAAGDQVQIVRQGTSALITGMFTPPRHPGVTGTILSVSGTTVNVSTAVGPLSARIQTGYTPAVGHIAVCNWSPWPDENGNWDGVVTGQVATTPPKTAGNATGTSSDQGKTTPVKARGLLSPRPVDAATWQGGRWRSVRDVDGDLIQGFIAYAPNSAYAFYGSQFAAGRGATATKAEIFLSTRPGIYTGSRTTRLVLHSSQRRPSGQPATTHSGATITLAAGVSGWYTIPVAWGQALMDGTARGVGAVSSSSSDYIRFRGPFSGARHPDSFRVRINWSR